MKPDTAVINVLGKHNIHCEYHKNDESTKTVILVNGAFATTASFGQTVRYLRDKVNVLLFDLPYAGKSKEFNLDADILTKEDEVDILEYLISHYKVNYLMSVSWGGVSSLLALARRPPTIERAIIGSFSPVINKAMHDYMAGAREMLEKNNMMSAAQLLNNTVGRYLSGLVKSRNFDYLMSVQTSKEQIIFHINQIFDFDQRQYMQQFASIDVPVMFLNGELDEYTTATDVRQLSQFIPQSEFAVVKNAGHFLDLESRHLWKTVSEVIREYLFNESPIALMRKPVFSVPSPFAAGMGQELVFAEAAD
ncbi:alpha/beta fold hydrolase [Granulicella arctica]|uniref:alpha/beta fold hydrolase n=1 Tax=Granulicella arctica TaxID=940613 RepID=UPI0021DF9C5C|nr:alpha/beta hydrolase [Granulicella arctica]